MNDYTIRPMTIEDYEEVYALWTHIRGFGIRSIDDSKEDIARFLERNPNTSAVAICDDKIVGNILCGHDGRQGSFYHVAAMTDARAVFIMYVWPRSTGAEALPPGWPFSACGHCRTPGSTRSPSSLFRKMRAATPSGGRSDGLPAAMM